MMMFLVSSVRTVPSLRLHLDLAGRGDARLADDGFGLVLLEQEFDARVSSPTTLSLCAIMRGQIEADLRLDAELGEILATLRRTVRWCAAAPWRGCSRH